jgi:hypothetical protein
MSEFMRLLVLVVLTGVVLTVLGAAVAWWNAETRRLKRGLRHVLGADPHALLVAQGRGRGVGFNFASNKLAVAWDGGAWCLVYGVAELVGAELVVDGKVLARVYRGEPRRPLDAVSGAEKQVRLRLVFDVPAHPDFDLDLWLPEDDTHRQALTATEAVREANRWLARTESLLRRPSGAGVALPVSNAAQATAVAAERARDGGPPVRAVRAPPAPPPTALPFDEPEDDQPPFAVEAEEAEPFDDPDER